jgi:hypothetical protein
MEGRTSRWRPGVMHTMPHMEGLEVSKPLYQVEARPVKT